MSAVELLHSAVGSCRVVVELWSQAKSLSKTCSLMSQTPNPLSGLLTEQWLVSVDRRAPLHTSC